MPSLPHEAPLLLFRHCPELVVTLLRDVLKLEVPEFARARIESGNLTQVTPTEYNADTVVLLEREAPVLGVIVEVQLSRVAQKRRAWPVYASTLRARFACPACVLVITPTAALARWAAAEIEIGPGHHMRPLVLGPREVPVIEDVRRAAALPELAVLSAMAHGRSEPERAARVGLAALSACIGLEDERSLLYSDFIRVALGKAAQAALEELMSSQEYEFQSEFARRHQAKGEALGVAKGEALGVTKGEAAALLAIFKARGFRVSQAQRERVEKCTDLSELERWIERAVTVSDIEDVFA